MADIPQLPDPNEDRELYDAIQDLYREMEGEEGILNEALQNGGAVDYDKIVDRGRLIVAAKFLVIVRSMVDLARNAESETVKLAAQKASISFLTGTLEDAGKGSGLNKLIDRLMEPSGEGSQSEEKPE